MRRAILLATLISGLLGTIHAQTETNANISAVAGAGAVTAYRYSNSFFRLTVNVPDATLQLNPLVSAPAERARLVQILSKQATWEDTYTFGVLADSLTRYPQLNSPAQYVRSVRHQLEKEGMPTVREEFTIGVSEAEFTGAILQEQVQSGRKYYRGIYATFRNGYILSFDVEASSPEKLNALVTGSVTIGR
jgi:hypothetical protein